MTDYSVRHRHRLKNKVIKKLADQIERLYSMKIDLSSSVMDSATVNNFEVIIVDKEILFIKLNDQPCLTVRGILKFRPEHKFVTVDMGAVKFVTNGADIMAPGIVDADPEINVDDIVWIRDENHKQPLAIGRALMTGPDMVMNDSEKAVKSIHYVNDKLWKIQV